MITAALVMLPALLVKSALIIRSAKFDECKAKQEQRHEQHTNEHHDLWVVQMEE